MKPYNGFTHSQRMASHRWLQKQYQADNRIRPSCCDVCGQTDGIIDAHSEDYSTPYGDHIGKYGLCYPCHMMIHCRFSAPEAFQRYVDLLLSGKRVKAYQTRNWPRFKVRLLSGEIHVEDVEDSTGGCMTLDDVIARR